MEIIRYIDTDVVGGTGDGTSWANAYSTISAWEYAEETDLVADGNWHHVYVRASSGTVDNSYGYFCISWVTGPDNYILMESASTDRATKTGYDTTKFHVEGIDVELFIICTPYFRLDGIQIATSLTSSGIDAHAIEIYVPSYGTSSDVRISNCYVKALSCEGNGPLSGIICWASSDTNIIINNTIVEDFDGINNDFHAFYLQNVENQKVYNCIVRNCYEGYKGGNIKNSAVINCTDDFIDNYDIDYCASDSGEGTNSVMPRLLNWDNEFLDSDNSDYTLISSGNLFEEGTDDPSGGIYSTDMDGDSWISPWSIGVDQLEIVPFSGNDNMTFGGDGLDDNLGKLFLGAGDEVEIRGVVYISITDESTYSEDIDIDSIINSIEKKVPTYFIVYLGYTASDGSFIKLAEV